MSESAFDVAIVGAGPAGLGCALALQEVGVERFVVLDSQKVGASFERWPEEMRLITPSFHSNLFFATDLNAVSPRTSPGDLFGMEHLLDEEEMSQEPEAWLGLPDPFASWEPAFV